MTALMWACQNEEEEAAALLMEATKKAGALDLQVNVAWSGWCEG